MTGSRGLLGLREARRAANARILHVRRQAGRVRLSAGAPVPRTALQVAVGATLGDEAVDTVVEGADVLRHVDVALGPSAKQSQKSRSL